MDHDISCRQLCYTRARCTERDRKDEQYTHAHAVRYPYNICSQFTHDAWGSRRIEIPIYARLLAGHSVSGAQCHGAGILLTEPRTRLPYHLFKLFHKGHPSGKDRTHHGRARHICGNTCRRNHISGSVHIRTGTGSRSETCIRGATIHIHAHRGRSVLVHAFLLPPFSRIHHLHHIHG